MRDIVLCPADLAVIARDLLIKNGGFTIDEYGKSAEGDFWAVAVEGKEHRCTMFGPPPLEEFEKYLLKWPIHGSGEYFGGYICAGRCVLDHALLFAHKHTAVHEGLRQEQQSIYHLGTGKLLELEQFDSAFPIALANQSAVEPCDHPLFKDRKHVIACPECGANIS